MEGLLVGIPIGCLLLPWKIKWPLVDKSRLMKNVLLPLCLFILAIIFSTGAYNKKITGINIRSKFSFMLSTQALSQFTSKTT